MDPKKTPLYDQHTELKAKIVNFGGWSMPVSYSSVIDEHKTVRERCGIFDVSHMGEIEISGKDANSFLQRVTINDTSKLTCGKGQYTAMLNNDGGFIDDLILYQTDTDSYLACVNAGNIDTDYDWLNSQINHESVLIKNISEKTCQIAVQGPLSQEALTKALPTLKEDISQLSYMDISNVDILGHSGHIARTGYTGELGYEVYLPESAAKSLWNALLVKNEELGIKPIGLGARDTLRLEASYLLCGQDMDAKTSPLAAGISWAVRFETDFIGKNSLLTEKESTTRKKMVGFVLKEKGIPRSGMGVYCENKKVGRVTSGSFLPTLNLAGGLAIIDQKSAKVGDEISIDVRGKRKLAEVKKRPLYSARVK